MASHRLSQFRTARGECGEWYQRHYQLVFDPVRLVRDAHAMKRRALRCLRSRVGVVRSEAWTRHEKSDKKARKCRWSWLENKPVGGVMNSVYWAKARTLSPVVLLTWSNSERYHSGLYMFCNTSHVNSNILGKIRRFRAKSKWRVQNKRNCKEE